MSDSDEPSAEVKKEVDEKATGDNLENASAGNKTTQGGRKSRAKFPPPRSMSNDEYAEIFDAVLARMEAEQLAEADAAAAKQLDLNIKEDDFDAILQETDKVIGNYVDAFLGDDEEEVEKFNKEDVVTSTPVLEQILHSSQEEAEKKTKKKEKKEKERKEVIQPKEKERKAVIQPKEKERKEVIQPKKVKKHPSSEVKETASKEQEKISKRELMQKREIATAGTWVQCEACGKWRYLAEMVDPALLPQRWTCADNTDEMHNCCNDAEEDWSEDEHTDDYVFNKFTEGSIVWARMSGFPWWPAMVEDDPDEDCYFECNVNMDRAHGMTNVATHYHVVFFDDKVSRAWVCSSNVHVFTGMEDMGSCKVRGVNYKKQIEKAVQNAMSCLELSLEERIKKCGFAVRYNGRWGSTKEKKEKKKTKKRKKKSGSDHDTETSILEKVEKLLESTENVLDGMLSQSDSEHDTSVPVKKRKVQADKKPKKKENKEPVKKPTFVKKAPKATTKKQESAGESEDGEQVKKKPKLSEDKPPTAKKPAQDKPAPKEKAQKKVKSEDDISGSPKKKIVKEEEDESEPQKKKPKKEKSDVKKETTKSDSSTKETPQKDQKSAKTPKKENKSDKEKKEKVLKPVFGAPKVKKTVAKDPKKENDTKDSNVEKPVEEDNEEKKSNDEKSSTETDQVSPKKSPEKEKPKPKTSEKIKPVIPKPKKAFMAPIVKKSDTNDEKKTTKEKPKMVQEKANKEKESKSEQKDKATDKEKESKSEEDGKSEQKNKAAGKKQKEAKVKDEVTDEQDDKEDREQKDEVSDEADNKSAKEKDEDTASKEIEVSANESSVHDKDSTSECENSFAQSPDPNESMKLSLKPEEFVDTTKKVDEMDAPVAQAVQEDSDFDFEE